MAANVKVCRGPDATTATAMSSTTCANDGSRGSNESATTRGCMAMQYGGLTSCLSVPSDQSTTAAARRTATASRQHAITRSISLVHFCVEPSGSARSQRAHKKSLCGLPGCGSGKRAAACKARSRRMHDVLIIADASSHAVVHSVALVPAVSLVRINALLADFDWSAPAVAQPEFLLPAGDVFHLHGVQLHQLILATLVNDTSATRSSFLLKQAADLIREFNAKPTRCVARAHALGILTARAVSHQSRHREEHSRSPCGLRAFAAGHCARAQTARWPPVATRTARRCRIAKRSRGIFVDARAQNGRAIAV